MQLRLFCHSGTVRKIGKGVAMGNNAAGTPFHWGKGVHSQQDCLQNSPQEVPSTLSRSSLSPKPQEHPQASHQDQNHGSGPESFPELLRADETLDRALRPLSFDDFVGQDDLVRNLRIFIQAACVRGESLDHVLLHGPPGLGKTTLAHLTATAMKGTLRTTSGPVLTKPGDLAALLTQLQNHDVLFIDEIHRLPVAVEELLYSAMEDYRIDILLGQGPHARALQLTLPPFTLIGATTRSGLLSAPLRDRFGIALALEFYNPAALSDLIMRAAKALGFALTPEAARCLAQRSRGTPRIALRLLRRVRDFGGNGAMIDDAVVDCALNQLGINDYGLDRLDQKYLHVLQRFFGGGPAGLDTLAAALSETRDTVEDVIEPYLLQSGLIMRTPRGRKITDHGQMALQATR
jgi:Holliday junction DNA helicase RuvB